MQGPRHDNDKLAASQRRRRSYERIRAMIHAEPKLIEAAEALVRGCIPDLPEAEVRDCAMRVIDAVYRSRVKP